MRAFFPLGWHNRPPVVVAVAWLYAAGHEADMKCFSALLVSFSNSPTVANGGNTGSTRRNYSAHLPADRPAPGLSRENPMLIGSKVGWSAGAILIAWLCVPPVIGWSHVSARAERLGLPGAAIEATTATLCPFEETAGRQLVSPLAVCSLLQTQKRYLI
jgi:hypothetical protein